MSPLLWLVLIIVLLLVVPGLFVKGLFWLLIIAAVVAVVGYLLDGRL